MLKFFRRIRQNLLAEGKNANYFKYAIGEIVLVVIGILIALQINNWNIERIENKQEQQVLLQLKSEYEENLREIDNKTAMRNDMLKAANRILSIKEGVITNIAADTIAQDIFTLSSTPTFNPVVGTTNELLSSGKLYLINNNELKSILTNWSGKTERLMEYEQDLRHFYNDQFNPYLSKNHSVKALFNGIWETDLLNFKKRDKSAEAQAIINDSEIDDYIINIATICIFASEDGLSIRKDIELILTLVNTELNN